MNRNNEITDVNVCEEKNETCRIIRIPRLPVSEVCVFSSRHDAGGRGAFCYLLNDFIGKHECNDCPAYNMHLFSHEHLDYLYKRVERLTGKGEEVE